jgi:hypothetical protein
MMRKAPMHAFVRARARAGKCGVRALSQSGLLKTSEKSVDSGVHAAFHKPLWKRQFQKKTRRDGRGRQTRKDTFAHARAE